MRVPLSVNRMDSARMRIDRHAVDEFAQKALTGSELIERNKFVGPVCLLDIAGPADDARNPRQGEQPGFGAVGDLASVLIRGERAYELRDGGLLRRIKPGRGGIFVISIAADACSRFIFGSSVLRA